MGIRGKKLLQNLDTSIASKLLFFINPNAIFDLKEKASMLQKTND